MYGNFKHHQSWRQPHALEPDDVHAERSAATPAALAMKTAASDNTAPVLRLAIAILLTRPVAQELHSSEFNQMAAACFPRHASLCSRHKVRVRTSVPADICPVPLPQPKIKTTAERTLKAWHVTAGRASLCQGPLSLINDLLVHNVRSSLESHAARAMPGGTLHSRHRSARVRGRASAREERLCMSQ